MPYSNFLMQLFLLISSDKCLCLVLLLTKLRSEIRLPTAEFYTLFFRICFDKGNWSACTFYVAP